MVNVIRVGRRLETIGHQIIVPAEYNETEEKCWPLILFLHGINKRGEDINQLNQYGILGMYPKNINISYFLLAPHCPSGSNWVIESDAIISLIEQICRSYRICRNRIFITGFSMGGNGVWHLAALHRDIIAAAAPLAGWYHVEDTPKLIGMPIWAFHGEYDDVVPVNRTIELVEMLEEKGGNIIFTCLKERKHNIMADVYLRPPLYKWFLKHRKNGLCVSNECY